MLKQYILDSNILMFDSNSPQQFVDNHVIIPLCVIREIDKFKKDMNSEVGRNARVATRELDALRMKGNLGVGVKTEQGGIIQVVPSDNPDQHVDYQILDLAKKLNTKEKPCIVVTKDVNLRIQCDVMGISAEDYETGQVDITNEIYTGYTELILPREAIEEFRHEHMLELPKGSFSANQYLIMKADDEDKNGKAMARVNAECNKIIPLIRAPREFGAIQPKNMEQCFLIDALLDENIKLVTVSGRAGSGKTLLSVLASYYQTVESRTYSKMLVARPIVPMGNDLGYLPGSLAEKLLNWTIPIYDAFDFIAESKNGNGKSQGKQYNKSGKKQQNQRNERNEKNDSREYAKSKGQVLMESSGRINVEPLTYIRGRSLHKSIVLIDEAQNLDSGEVKTIITRAGLGSKIILEGDVDQIDHKYLDSMSNGLSYVIGRFRGQKLYAHMTLQKGERSELSELGSILL